MNGKKQLQKDLKVKVNTFTRIKRFQLEINFRIHIKAWPLVKVQILTLKKIPYFHFILSMRQQYSFIFFVNGMKQKQFKKMSSTR